MKKESVDCNVRLNKLINQSDIGIILLDKELTTIFQSTSTKRILGWTIKNQYRNGFEELVHPSDQAIFEDLILKVSSAPGLTRTCNLQVRHLDGHYVSLECTFTDLFNDQDIAALVCNFRNITVQKNIELELARQKADIQNVLETMTDGFIILDENFCYTYVNEKVGNMLGRSVESMIGKHIWTLFPEAIGSITYQGIETAFRDQIYVCNEDFFPPLQLWQENRVYPSAGGISMFIRDITQQKKEELRQKLLESVITNTTDAVMITAAEPINDPGPEIIYVNEAFTRMTGYTAEEIIGKSPRILQGPKTDKKELARMKDSMSKWESCEITVINYKKNGEEFLIQFTITPVADESGWFTHWISVERDVTEQIKLQHDLKQIFELAPDVICTVGIDGYFKSINPALCRLLEYTLEELLARPIVKIIHPDEQVRIMTQLDKSNKGTNTFYFENRCITKTGKIKWLAWTSTPATESGLIFTVAKDITDKKELEDLLHKATNLAGIGGWDIDLVQNTVFWSAITRQIHEVESDYQPDIKTGILFYKDLDEQKAITEHIERSIANRHSFDVELQIVTAKGNVRWVRVIGEPEFVGQKCIRMRGSFQDIDARKVAELLAAETLRERDVILESIGDAFFAVSVDWLVTYWNQMAEIVLHKSKEEILGKNLWVVFSDSVQSESYKKYHQAVSTQIPVHFQDYYKPLKKWYEISAYPSVNGLSVYFKDITDRKQNENLLKDSEKRYSDLFQFSPIPKWVYNQKNLAFLDVNDAALLHYGYTREEFLNMTLKDIRPPSEVVILDQVLKLNRRKKDTGKQGIFTHMTKTGKLISVDIQSNPITYKGIKAKVIIANDVTERLNYIKAIEEQNTKLREISWIQSHVVRAPLARIMGLVELLAEDLFDWEEKLQMLGYLKESSEELDGVVKQITKKTISEKSK
ncbi:MAG: PAS domain S-box protein [Bacteroidota bacterium]